MKDYLELTKPRICVLALIMASLGYFLARHGIAFDFWNYFFTMLGLTLVGAGCGALNQFLEREIDFLMPRTRQRPLPAKRLLPTQALLMGIPCSVVGLAVLYFGVNSLTAVLGAFTLFTYLAVYTPAKRWTSFSTLLGAIPGALPPLMGQTAVTGHFTIEGVLLFAILFIWQVPHFLAIAWIYRDEYAKAGLPILTVIDEKGLRTAKQSVLYSMVLLPLSLLPSIGGVAGRFYFVGALVLGTIFLGYSVAWALYRSKQEARRLFLVSILYLPALGILMLWDKL